MKSVVAALLTRLSDPRLRNAEVIPWSCPVPVFGNLATSYVATLGLNPSNREFVDAAGNELNGEKRRFETLGSLGLANWRDVGGGHLHKILQSFQDYFSNNPYDGWFKKLDTVIAETSASYYRGTASHLDLIPYATFRKWGWLSSAQRDLLFKASGSTLPLLLRDSPVRVLILNGASVAAHFQVAFGLQLQKSLAPEWSLRSATDSPVLGRAFKATIHTLGGVSLNRSVVVLGFNHNIQSSFGVTREVTTAIKRWIGAMSEEHLVKA
jgi:hypothetical protein